MTACQRTLRKVLSGALCRDFDSHHGDPVTGLLALQYTFVLPDGAHHFMLTSFAAALWKCRFHLGPGILRALLSLRTAAALFLADYIGTLVSQCPSFFKKRSTPWGMVRKFPGFTLKAKNLIRLSTGIPG